MHIPQSLTTVTPLSKSLALVMLVAFPIAAFILGMRYQSLLDGNSQTPPAGISCTMEAKVCPDGSSVGRVPPKCEFLPCPTLSPTGTYEICGGIAGLPCPEDYVCVLDGNYPDASGKCINSAGESEYACPESDYVNCMPILTGEAAAYCTPEYLKWAGKNCPGFQGPVY